MAEQLTAPGPIILSVNAIVNGTFFSAGTALPFTAESELPESLKPFIATAEAPPPEPVQRNIYDMSPPVRRQARRLEMHAAHQELAEQVASEPLPEDVQAALESEHDIAIGRAKAQAEYNQSVVDAAYAAAQADEPPQRYVRRGGEWGHVERAKLKPGETVFVKRENGEMEAVGVVDATGGLPPQEIQL